MLPISLLWAALATIALGDDSEAKWSGPMSNLVTFGDSYTDEHRLGYFATHDGQPPPPGTLLPESNATASGGYEWGRLAANKTGARYYNYAVSGAACSNEIIYRYKDAVHGPYPSVFDYEVPAFQADVKFKDLYPHRYGSNTVYALWIGTNDLGTDAFLTDSNAAGTTISDYVECIWQVFDGVYKTGGRNFVLLNTALLHLSPMYTPLEDGGAPDTPGWADKSKYNNTEYQYKMLEYTTTVNRAFLYGIPYNLLLERRWPGATMSLFDVHSLMLDLRENADSVYDAPANVTGYYHQCDVNNNCHDSTEPKSSYMWYDPLHPSERTHEYIANTLIDVVYDKSKYGKRYRS